MPAAVHISSQLASRKLALTSQSSAEANNGLVTVSLQFVTTAAMRDAAARSFYVDAPPPIWPSSIVRDELLGRQLFMTDRDISQENGLVTISASYVGGLNRRSSFVGFSADRQSPVTSSYSSGLNEAGPFLDPETNTTYTTILFDYWSYQWTPIVQIVRFVRVADQDSFAPEVPKHQSMYSLLSFSGAYRLSPSPRPPYGTDYPREFFVNKLETKPVREETKIEQITPSVATVERSFFLE
jgi:hypothetical protein